MSILSHLITQTELERLMRLSSQQDPTNANAIWLAFDVIVGNIETAFDNAIKKRITDHQSNLNDLDMEDIESTANDRLEDEFRDQFTYDLDFMETGILLGQEIVDEIRSEMRDGALTQIDTQACDTYVKMKRPIRSGLLEELRQAVNNHYLAMRDHDRAVDDVQEMYIEIEQICNTYAEVFTEYDINQTELRNEVTRIGEGPNTNNYDFRDPPEREDAQVIPIDRARRQK